MHLTKGTEVIVIVNLKTRMTITTKLTLQVKASALQLLGNKKRTSNNRHAEGDNLSDNNNEQQVNKDLDDEITKIQVQLKDGNLLPCTSFDAEQIEEYKHGQTFDLVATTSDLIHIITYIGLH